MGVGRRGPHPSVHTCFDRLSTNGLRTRAPHAQAHRAAHAPKVYHVKRHENGNRREVRARGVAGVTIGEGALLLIRWCHAMAAVTWVGGTLFYVLALRPRGTDAEPRGPALSPEALARFRGVVDTAIAVLVITGAVMLFDRLSEPTTPPAYTVAAAVKVSLAVVMFVIARRRWRRPAAAEQRPAGGGVRSLARYLTSGVNLTIILGITVIFLSDLLAFIYQQGLTGR